ncbi:hypothetical protein vseg_011876 [Gypsophila vaccaria]
MSRVNLADENRLQEARRSLARWVCNEEVSPLSLLDQRGPFKLFSNSLNPHFHRTLSLKSLQEDCLKIYEEQREKVKKVFSTLDGRISISVDSLVNENTWHFYECISAHFIDNDWNLKKWVVKYYGGEHYSNDDNSLDDLVALKEWDIESKVLSLTCDSDTADSVKEDIQVRRELLLNGQLFHVQCNCDMVSQMAQSAFKMIDKIIDEVQLLSWSKSLPLWYLTTSKLKNALELKTMGEFSTENIGDDYKVPSEEEWDKVRSVCRITDRIYQITKPLHHAKKQTANLYLPHVIEIHSFLVQESGSSDQFVKALAEKMLETYTMYWNDMYLMLGIAAFMDPRYKMRLIEFSSPKLLLQEKVSNVLDTIRKLYDSYVLQNNEKHYVLTDSSSESEDEDNDEEEDNDKEDEEMTEPLKGKKIDNLIDKLKILQEYWSAQSVNAQPFKSDLDIYLEEPVLPWTENFSVLNWWKDNCSKYPQLSRMARDFLAVPLSVATSYDAYYTEPRPADTTVVSLKPELMNALMCTRSWKFGYNN